MTGGSFVFWGCVGGWFVQARIFLTLSCLNIFFSRCACMHDFFLRMKCFFFFFSAYRECLNFFFRQWSFAWFGTRILEGNSFWKPPSPHQNSNSPPLSTVSIVAFAVLVWQVSVLITYRNIKRIKRCLESASNRNIRRVCWFSSF